MGRTRDFLQALFRRDEVLPPGGGKKQRDDQDAALDQLAAWYQSRTALSPKRTKRYVDYRDMAEDPMISGALDLYADDACQPDPFRRQVIWPQSQNKQVVRLLRDMIDEAELPVHAWPYARSVAQYGDLFARILARPGKGIVGLERMEPEHMKREIDKYGRLTGFSTTWKEGHTFDPWEFVHFRVIGSSMPIAEGGSIYGTSLLEAARRPFRQLRMLEDSVVIYRLEIGGRHRVFYVDVTGLSYAQGIAETRKIELSFGKKEYFNPDNKEWSAKYEPLYLSNDIFWPVRKDSTSRVEYMGTDPNVTGVADLEFIRYNLHAALKAPRAFLGGDDFSGAGAKYGLSQVYIVFSRLVKRLQQAQIAGYTRMGQIHLALNDVDPLDKANRFSIMMMQPSSLDHEQRLEALELAVELAVKVKQSGEFIGIDPEIVKQQAQMIFLGLTPYDLAQLGRDVSMDSSLDGGTDLQEGMASILAKHPGLKLQIEAFRHRHQLEYADPSDNPSSWIVERSDNLFPAAADAKEVDLGTLREDYAEYVQRAEELAMAGKETFMVEIDEDTLSAIVPYLKTARSRGGLVQIHAPGEAAPDGQGPIAEEGGES